MPGAPGGLHGGQSQHKEQGPGHLVKNFSRGSPEDAEKVPACPDDSYALSGHDRILVQISLFHSGDPEVDELNTQAGAPGLVSRGARSYNELYTAFSGGGIVQLDDHLKQLLRELGHAINDTVSESGRISEAISDVRSAGFDIVLKLDATIGLARRDADDSRITTNDRRFLESLHIQVDQEILNEEQETPKFEMTPQDLRFLKSLKITLDDAQ